MLCCAQHTQCKIIQTDFNVHFTNIQLLCYSNVTLLSRCYDYPELTHTHTYTNWIEMESISCIFDKAKLHMITTCSFVQLDNDFCPCYHCLCSLSRSCSQCSSLLIRIVACSLFHKNKYFSKQQHCSESELQLNGKQFSQVMENKVDGNNFVFQ